MRASALDEENEAAQRRDLLRSRYSLGVLALVGVFASMDRMALSILLEPIKHELHISDQKLGLLSGLAFAAFYATLGLPLARVADRYSRVKLLSACMALWSIMTMLSGMARSFPQLFLARMGVGVGEAGCTPSAHSLIGDYFPGARRSLAISIYQCGATFGASVGMILVGFLGERLGWRGALQVIGIAGVPMALLILFTMRDPRSTASKRESSEPAMTALRALLARPAFTHLVLAYGLGGISTYGVSQWAPTFLIRSFGLTVVQAGAWGGLAAAVGGVLGLLSGGVFAAKLVARDARWELWLPAVTNAICLPIYAMMFLSSTAWLALVLKTCATFVAAAGAGVALSAVQSFAEPHRRATAIAVLFFVTSLVGSGLGPYLIGVVSDLLAPELGRESLRYALLLSCVILAWSTIHFVVAARSSVRDRVA